MADENHLKQLGIGVASLTFGVALSVFIFAAATGIVNSMQAGLLFVTSFLLMLRFWWRYTEVFARFLPSRNYWHFLFDFAISFFSILAVLSVGNIQTWALLGIAAMIASMVRCGMSWKDAKNKDVKQLLKRTLYGSVAMLIILGIVYLLVPLVDNNILSAAVLIIVLIFVIISSWRK